MKKKEKLITKSFKIEESLMKEYSKFLKSRKVEFSSDIRFMIQLRIVTSSEVSLDVKNRILKEIEKEIKK